MAYRIISRKAGQKPKVVKDTTKPRSVKPSDLDVGVFSASPAAWNMESWSAGINPDHVQEQMAVDRLLGVPTEYTTEGDAVFTDRAHRRKYLATHGCFDKSGGYSDPDPDEMRRTSAEANEILAANGITAETWDPPPDPVEGISELAAMQHKTKERKRA
jgi:hypothetical protein